MDISFGLNGFKMVNYQLKVTSPIFSEIICFSVNGEEWNRNPVTYRQNRDERRH